VKVGTADDAARLDAVRKAVGDEVALRADANGAWNAHEAIEQLQRLEQFKLAAIEQPVPAKDLEGMKRVRAESGIPVMADESLVTLEQANQLIELGACQKTAASPAAWPSPSSRMKQASRSKSARK
jgi:L-alanine-DL-glutamate epimerase-like enolase superfamily enzyme